MQPGILAYFLCTCQSTFNWNWRPVTMERVRLRKLAAMFAEQRSPQVSQSDVRAQQNSRVVLKPPLRYWPKKKKRCNVDLWRVSVLLWLHGPSVMCFDAAVKALMEHFCPELSSVMMLSFKKSAPSGVITRLCQTELSLCLWSTSIISRRRRELCVL